MGEIINRSQEFLASGEKTWEEMTELLRNIERKSDRSKLEEARERGKFHADAIAKREEEKSDGTVRFDPPTIQKIYDDAAANYNTGVKAYQFCNAFPTDGHMKGLTLSACLETMPVLKWYKSEYEKNKLDNPQGFNQTTPEKRAFTDFHDEFISSLAAGYILATDDATGTVHRDPLTLDDIRHHCKRKRGIPTSKPSKNLEKATDVKAAMERMESTIKSLGLSAKKESIMRTALTAEMARVDKAIHASFHSEVENAAIELGKKQAAQLISYNKTRQAELDREVKLADARSKGLPSLIGKSEYKFLNQLFHADNNNVPDSLRKKFDKAYLIIQKIGSGADWR